MFDSNEDALAMTFEPNTPPANSTYVLTQATNALDRFQRDMQSAKREIEDVLMHLEAARAMFKRGEDVDILRRQTNHAVGLVLEVARSARASGGVQSFISDATANAGYLQAIFETGQLKGRGTE